MRPAVGFVVGAAAAAFGALILGEYQFTGFTPYAAGTLFGLVVAEVVATVGRRRGWVVGVGSGLLAAGGIVWAAWISAGRDWSYVPGSAWLGAALALVAAPVWVGRPTTTSSTSSEPPTDDSR